MLRKIGAYEVTVNESNEVEKIMLETKYEYKRLNAYKYLPRYQEWFRVDKPKFSTLKAGLKRGNYRLFG